MLKSKAGKHEAVPFELEPLLPDEEEVVEVEVALALLAELEVDLGDPDVKGPDPESEVEVFLVHLFLFERFPRACPPGEALAPPAERLPTPEALPSELLPWCFKWPA